jgi:hypothetical protein
MSDQDSDRIAEENARGKLQTEPPSSLHTKLQTILSDVRTDFDYVGDDDHKVPDHDDDYYIAQILQEVKKYLEAGGEL